MGAGSGNLYGTSDQTVGSDSAAPAPTGITSLPSGKGVVADPNTVQLVATPTTTGWQIADPYGPNSPAAALIAQRAAQMQTPRPAVPYAPPAEFGQQLLNRVRPDYAYAEALAAALDAAGAGPYQEADTTTVNPAAPVTVAPTTTTSGKGAVGTMPQDVNQREAMIRNIMFNRD